MMPRKKPMKAPRPPMRRLPIAVTARACLNRKGGAGEATLALCLAAILADSAAMVDLDVWNRSVVE